MYYPLKPETGNIYIPDCDLNKHREFRVCVQMGRSKGRSHKLYPPTVKVVPWRKVHHSYDYGITRFGGWLEVLESKDVSNLKVGDIVRVRKDIKEGTLDGGFGVTKDMEALAGQKIRISNVTENVYTLGKGYKEGDKKRYEIETIEGKKICWMWRNILFEKV